MRIVLSAKSISLLFATLVGSIGIANWREERLLASAKRREPGSFEDLQAMHSEALRRFIARRVAPADREDLYQETWVSAWERLPSLEDRGKFRAWLLTIGFRRIQDYRRREHVRPRLAMQLEDISASYTEAGYQQVELKSTLQAFWNTCSTDQQEVLTMYYADGLTLAEIAKITGKT